MQLDTVESVEFDGYEDVYNMTVEDTHNYILDNGLVSKNCDALRYFVAGRPCKFSDKRIVENKDMGELIAYGR